MTIDSQRWTGLGVLYVGAGWGTSLDRARALQRLGCEVQLVDPWKLLPSKRVAPKLLHETGASVFDRLTARALRGTLAQHRYDLVWVNCGELIGPDAMETLKAHAGLVVNYNNDNPFTRRDKKKWRLYKQAIPFYDLLVVVHETSVPEAQALGAKDVLRMFLTADELACRTRELTLKQKAEYESEVVFVGTWLKGRGTFMAELIDQGIPVSIWGDRWQRAPEWRRICDHWRGPAVYDPDEYAAALMASKICLGLLSHENLNQHTDRSIQIPALGALLCAERTKEHVSMYEEGEEAVFWADAEECAKWCRVLLDDDDRRNAIAGAGHERCMRNGLFNEQALGQILERSMADGGTSHTVNRA